MVEVVADFQGLTSIDHHEKGGKKNESRVITRLYEGKPPDHVVFLKMSRRDKAMLALLKNLSANFNAFLFERSWHLRVFAEKETVDRSKQEEMKEHVASESNAALVLSLSLSQGLIPQPTKTRRHYSPSFEWFATQTL